MVIVMVITATTVISNVIIGPPFRPDWRFPRSANHRPWYVRSVQVRPIRIANLFGKPHREFSGLRVETISLLFLLAGGLIALDDRRPQHHHGRIKHHDHNQPLHRVQRQRLDDKRRDQHARNPADRESERRA
jgi:hypothetical protein